MSTEILKKYHYDSMTGQIDNHPYYDDDSNIVSPFIELSYAQWKQYLKVVEYGKMIVYKNGLLSVEDDLELQATTEYKQNIINSEIDYLKMLLNRTDYIIPKIQEASLLGEDVEALKTQYAEQLTQRQEARARINELEAQLKTLG